MAQKTTLSPIGLPGRVYSFVAKAVASIAGRSLSIAVSRAALEVGMERANEQSIGISVPLAILVAVEEAP